jgi:hypothetical protein
MAMIFYYFTHEGAPFQFAGALYIGRRTHARERGDCLLFPLRNKKSRWLAGFFVGVIL